MSGKSLLIIGVLFFTFFTGLTLFLDEPRPVEIPVKSERTFTEGTVVGRDATILYLRQTGQLDTTGKVSIDFYEFLQIQDSLEVLYYEQDTLTNN